MVYLHVNGQLHTLMTSEGKNLRKLIASWPNLAYLLRLEYQNAQIAPP